MIRTEWQADAETFGYDNRPNHKSQIEAQIRHGQWEIKQYRKALGVANALKNLAQRRHFQAAAFRQLNYYRNYTRRYEAQLMGMA